MQAAFTNIRTPRILDEQHIEVFFPSETPDSRAIPCQIGRDINLRHDHMQKACFRKPSDEMLDLMMLAGAIAFCDRTITRRRSLGWSRNISLTMPVKNPDLWNSKKVLGALRDALGFLTFDRWDFLFVKREHSYQIGSHELSLEENKRHVVIPFSNGLDSLSLVAHFELFEPETKLILASAWNHSQAGSPKKWVKGSSENAKKHHRIRFPVEIKGRKPEGTYRTRAFLFLVLASVTALLAGADTVSIPENGQGIVGASLVPFGEEAPYRNLHPAFARKLSDFIYVLLNERINIHHPFLWKTKGAVLKEILGEDADFAWKDTSSCSRDARLSTYQKKKVHCGVCSNCLLRRMALHAAGVENDEVYLWADLNSSTFEAACAVKEKRVSTFRGGAAAAVLLMETLARMSEYPETHRVYQKASLEISGDNFSQVDAVSRKVSGLVKSHASEWEGFLDSLHVDSWVRSYARCLS